MDRGALNSRLSREGAQSGAITVSLMWNDPSDLDLHAHVKRNGQSKTEHIYFGHKRGAGGYLDVDMNVQQSGKKFSLEPVENIFWTHAPGGEYTIEVTNASTNSHPSKWGGLYADTNRDIPFKVFLNKFGEEDEFEGVWKKKDNKIVAFKFTVDGSGDVTAASKSAAKAAPKAKAAARSVASIPTAEQHDFLTLARDYKWDEVKAAVEATPALVNVQPAQRWSALHQAAGAGDLDIVRYLLEKSASVDATDKDGQTPLDVAASAAVKAALTKTGTKRKAEGEAAGKAKAKAKAKAKPLAGKKVVFSGTLSMTRAALTAAAVNAGAEVLSAVSGNVDIMIAGPGAGSKLSKAESLGTEVWSEEDFTAAIG